MKILAYFLIFATYSVLTRRSKICFFSALQLKLRIAAIVQNPILRSSFEKKVENRTYENEAEVKGTFFAT